MCMIPLELKTHLPVKIYPASSQIHKILLDLPYVITFPRAIQKQKRHLSEGQIEPSLIVCEFEWAFTIRALNSH